MHTAIVVDDEPITRMDFADMLEQAGFSVATACGDGFDAVEACRVHRPDVVLMDVKMPVFDGLSAAETIIREELAGCVVMLTAYCDKDFVDRAKQIGVAGYLVKPVEERTLLPAVEIALAQSDLYRKAVREAQGLKAQMQDKALVDRAKRILAKRDGITEGDAYQKLQKISMDKRRSMAQIAQMIVDTGGGRTGVDEAKWILVERYGVAEKVAFKKLRTMAELEGISLEDAAAKVNGKGG